MVQNIRVMNISNVSYTNPYQILLLKAFSYSSVRNLFSLPKIGSIKDFIFDKAILDFTKMLLEFSGLPEYIDDMDKEQAKKTHHQLYKIYSLLEPLVKQDINELKRQKEKDFFKLVCQLQAKLYDNLYLLEEKINKEYFFDILTNSPSNDWNDSANDHWDNY